jgi:hypothetical protein
MPVYITGFKSAREAYIAAVYPAGPEPMIRHFTCSVVSDILLKNEAQK